MGFKEKQFELLLENNLEIGKDRKILPSSKLIKLAGNSIVVPVLEKIFEHIDEINEDILKKSEMTLAWKNFPLFTMGSFFIKNIKHRKNNFIILSYCN